MSAKKKGVRIEVPALTEFTTKDIPGIQKWFGHYNCYLVESTFKKAYWVIYGDTAQDIFWLGCNWNNSTLNALYKEIEQLKQKI